MSRKFTDNSFPAPLDAIPDATIVVDYSGNIVAANEHAIEMFGYSTDELVGISVDSLLPETLREIHSRHREKYTTSPQRRPMGTGLDLKARRKDGSLLQVDISLSPLRTDAGTFVIAIVHDITERVQALEKKLETEKFYRALFEQSPDAVFILDLDGRHIGANQRAAEMLGYSPEEIIELSVWDISAQVDESMDVLNRILSGEQIPPYERSFRKKNGESLPVEIHLELIRDAIGQPYRIQSIVRDISERKHAEEKIRKQLRRLESLRSIDIAIAGSFDLNTVLDVALEQVSEQLGVDAVCLLLLNPHTQTLDFAAGRGFLTNALQHTTLRFGEGYAGQAARERRIIHIRNLQGRQTDFLRSPYFHQENFVTYFAVPIITKGQLRGVLEVFHRSPLEYDSDWLSFLETLAGQASIAVDNAQLFEGLQRANIDLIMAYDATIEGWSRALDLRDEETEGHTRRVTQMTTRLAREMGVNEANMIHIRRGALLHDIGKMGVPDRILLKPGPLTDDEWDIMRRHPRFAYEMLAPIAYLRPALDIPYCHHEKWDGTGYPRGLKGDEIPLAARIFAVVDVWDALRSDRPYRPAWPKEKVLDHIRSLSGTHFDPQVVEAFMRLSAEMGNQPGFF